MTKFAVITHVPDPETNDGNLASALVYRLPKDLQFHVMINGRTEVFALGEIVILNESGREIGGRGRKPSKWHINYELFDAVDAAVARSAEVVP